jgi:hypothetical protein
MLTIEKYEAYENSTQKILDGGVNVKTGVPFDIVKVDKNLDLIFEEHFAFQNAQARAHASGIISTEVAQIIYNALGEVMAEPTENGGWQPNVSTARKQSITQLMSELMQRRV